MKLEDEGHSKDFLECVYYFLAFYWFFLPTINHALPNGRNILATWGEELTPDAEKDWRQQKKQMTEDEMVGWHHRLKGHEFEQWVGDRQGSLVYYSPWGRKELDTTERLNWRPLQTSTHSSPSAQNPSLGQTSSELKSIITSSFWVRVVHVVRHLEPVISNFHLLLECEPQAEWSTGMGFRW